MAPLMTIPSMDLALGPLLGANHLEGDLKLVVKNTFLVVEDSFLDSDEIVPGPLGFPVRFVSEPPPMGARSGIERFDDGEEEREAATSVAASKEPNSEEEQETPIAALVRHTRLERHAAMLLDALHSFANGRRVFADMLAGELAAAILEGTWSEKWTARNSRSRQKIRKTKKRHTHKRHTRGIRECGCVLAICGIAIDWRSI